MRGTFVGIGSALVAVSLVLASSQAVVAQSAAAKPELVVGTWEGLSKGTNGEVPVKLDLKLADGKFTGSIDTPGMVLPVSGGRLEGDVLSLSFEVQGMMGAMTGKVDGGAFAGSWEAGGESGTVALKQVAPAGAGDAVTGMWAGEASVQGQPMPITLHLKLAGETVTGEIESAAGRIGLTAGSWKDGTLTVTFPYADGQPVTMGGKIADGKLGGVYDYGAGAAQGTWWAARK